MKILSIVDIFNRVPSDRIYIQNTSECVFYGDVKDSINQFREEHPYLVGKNCSLVTNSRFSLAKFLPLIASVANKILLQPKCLTDEVKSEFYEQSDIEYVIDIVESGVFPSKVSPTSPKKEQNEFDKFV